jgi:hypothetical protein
MSPALRSLIDTIESSLASRVDEAAPDKAKIAIAAVDELKHKLAIAEAAIAFYKDLPPGKRLLAVGILPIELTTLLMKEV